MQRLRSAPRFAAGLLAAASIFASRAACAPTPTPTLDRIKAAGTFACGLNTEENEYTTSDAHGNRAAFDADLCKALATAALGPNAVFKVVPFPDEEESLDALRAGKVDVVATASPTFRANKGKSGLGFSPIVLYDYQAILVDKTLGVASPKDLAGKKTCFVLDSPMQEQIEGYMEREGLKWIPGPFSEEGEMEAALITRTCAAVTADVTMLAHERIAFRGMARNFEILPDVVAKDPLAMAYRLDDPQWAAVVDWTVEALVEAEELGITKANLPDKMKSGDLRVRRLLGLERGWGQFLAVDDAWAARIVDTVGNYGEVFDRDLGAHSPMRMDRGPNKLWTEGGLMYALPIR
jgi:general L-amino acid transport system substrate-binding protein